MTTLTDTTEPIETADPDVPAGERARQSTTAPPLVLLASDEATVCVDDACLPPERAE